MLEREFKGLVTAMWWGKKSYETRRAVLYAKTTAPTGTNWKELAQQDELLFINVQLFSVLHRIWTLLFT